MSIPIFIRNLQLLDVRFTLQDGKLIVDAPDGVLNEDVLSQLRSLRPGILDHLHFMKKCEDMLVFMEERAAIMEHDGGLSRSEAEQRAYECTHSEWLNCNPPQYIDDQHCAQCGQKFNKARTGCISVLAGNEGHVRLHHHCHESWMARRWQKAINALMGMGIHKIDSTVRKHKL